MVYTAICLAVTYIDYSHVSSQHVVIIRNKRVKSEVIGNDDNINHADFNERGRNIDQSDPCEYLTLVL